MQLTVHRGGESLADVADRIHSFRDLLHRYFRDRPSTSNYVVVSHKVTTEVFLARIMRMSCDELCQTEFHGPNCAIYVIESSDSTHLEEGEEALQLVEVLDPSTGEKWVREPGEAHVRFPARQEARCGVSRSIRSGPPSELSQS